MSQQVTITSVTANTPVEIYYCDSTSGSCVYVSTVSVSLAEYGNASLVTRKLQLFSLSDVDPAVADIIAFNMADVPKVMARKPSR